MSTCSKKKKSENHTEGRSNFEEIPEDLVMEILGRLPAKSVVGFRLVSKSWARIIRSRYFIRSFEARSWSSQPRLLVCFIGQTRPLHRSQYCYFFSSSSSSTTFLSRVKSPIEDPEYLLYRSQYANGLLRLGHGKKILMCNPSTGKSITLPRVVRFSRSFFGYDPVNDQYKILHMKKNLLNGQESSDLYEYQVLTLGAEQSSWRTIEYSNPHRYRSNCHVCIDGVVYFIVRTGADWSQRSLVKFDLRYEKLDFVTSLSADMPSLCGPSLINYEGKVAITSNSSRSTFNVWVLDLAADPKHGFWLKKSFSIESWKSLSELRIYGSTHTGEFVLAPSHYSDDFNVILYNPNTKGLRKIKVVVKGGHKFKHSPRMRARAMVFSEYVESIRLL